jgi:hypothetical protein
MQITLAIALQLALLDAVRKGRDLGPAPSTSLRQAADLPLTNIPA